MKESKFKYHQELIRLCLFKVALLFSVFAFSGFNENIQATFQESVQSELIESSNFKPVFSLKYFSKYYKKLEVIGFLSIIKPYHSYTLLNFKKALKTKYKRVLEKSLSYDCSSIKLPRKKPLSSPAKEFPPLFIG